MANARTRRLPSEIIPDAHIATSQFVDMGGHLTLESHFGNDPLAGRDGLLLSAIVNFTKKISRLKSCPWYFMLSAIIIVIHL